jgi:hypothetical protein
MRSTAHDKRAALDARAPPARQRGRRLMQLALCHVRVAADGGEVGVAEVLGDESRVTGLLP